MKRTEVYINGIRATKYDIAMLFERFDEVTDMYWKNGKFYLKTI